MKFQEGDHVRLGAVRGGIVVQHDGKLRVRFPGAQRLLWLDLMVPDDGPDGRIYPNSWDECERCGNPSPLEICGNCERRAREAAVAFDASERRHEEKVAITNGEPSFGVHVASSIRHHGRTVEQRCANCGVVLHRYIGEAAASTLFREGQLVERTYLGLEVAKPAAVVTCRPLVTQRRSA